MILRCFFSICTFQFYLIFYLSHANIILKKPESKCDPHKEFQCVESGICIPLAYKCNASPDCLDGSDEPPDCQLPLCKSNQFQCRYTRKCIPKGWICDKEVDCGFINGMVDNSDEDGIQCHNTFSCSANAASCKNNSTCILIKKFCDGVADCPDNSDEGSYCHDNYSSHMNCSHGFKPVNGELKCFCPEGQQPQQNICVDVDECLIDGSCDQICLNTFGSYHCNCIAGYRKIKETGCEAINEPPNAVPFLFFSTTTHIKRIYLDGSFSKQLDMHTLSLTFDHRNRSVCFIHRGYNETKAVFTCMTEDFVPLWSHPGPPTFPLETTTHVALDWISGNWYFVDDMNEMIFVCSSEMSFCRILIDVNISKPKAIALDPTKGFMFFTKFGFSASLERALLNGKERLVLVEEKIVYPYGVTVDFPLEHVYWVDTYLDFVERVNYDGSNRQTVRKGFSVQNLYDVVVFEKDLYVSSWSNLSIIKLNKFQNEDHKIIASNISRPFSVIVYHRQRQPEVNHPCKINNGGCQHICIPLWLNKTVGIANCMCEFGFKIVGKKRCAPASRESFLLYAKGRPAMIKGISIPPSNGSTEEVVSPITGLSNPWTLDFDVKEQYIYFVDGDVGRKNIIERRKIDSSKRETVVKYNIYSCKGLAIDWLGRNLYWTDEEAGTVSVVSLQDFSKRRTLIRDKKIKLYSIVLDPNAGYMYWSRWSPGAIERAAMDGSNRTIFVGTNVSYPSGLSIDFLSNKLYWCDTLTEIIEWVSLDGSNRMKVSVSELNHPSGLAILNDLIFWIEQRGLLRSFNYNTKEEVTLITENPPLYDLKVFSSQSQNVLTLNEIWCLNVSKCQGLCVMIPNGLPICLCANGAVGDGCIQSPENDTMSNCEHFQCKSLERCVDMQFVCDGNKDCVDGSDESRSTGDVCEKKTCSPDEFQCDGNRCIPKSWICDGGDDCTDKTDEKSDNCFLNACSPTQFVCTKTRRCIPLSWVCDNDSDCGEGDSSDEHENCTVRKCSPAEFTCRNGICISAELHCNGEDDCHDCGLEDNCVSSDENCLHDCDEDKFYCKRDDRCLPNDVKCNGKIDCSDESDESHCPSYINTYSNSSHIKKCSPEEFRCQKIAEQCILKKYVCDGKPDCLDFSDELDCSESTLCVENECEDNLSQNTESVLKFNCDYPSRLCDKGKVCVAVDQLCDNHTDCVDYSDEGGRCGW